MDTQVLLLRDALNGAREVVRCLKSADWSRPTLCSSWSVRDVLDHMVATTTKFSGFAAGETDLPRTPRGDLLGEDPVAALEACCVTSANAWQAADLRRECRLPFGTFTALEAAGINAFDVSVHSWDIAQAAQLVYEPPTSLTALAYAVARQLVTPEAVAAGQYAEGVVTSSAVAAAPRWNDVLRLTGRLAPPLRASRERP